MITTARIFSAFGYVIFLGIFYFVEKKTGFPFITNDTSFIIISCIWVIIAIIVCICEHKMRKEYETEENSDNISKPVDLPK
jgi:hypothetical protein